MTKNVSSDETGQPCGAAQACPACQGKFVCGIAQGQNHCWCMMLPAVISVSPDQSCLCEACLKSEIARAQECLASRDS